MYIVIAILIAAVILAALIKLYLIFKNKINFFIEGMDRKFSIKELSLLWKVANLCNLEQPVSIFISMPSLTRCISHIKSQAEKEGTLNSAKNQNILSKLYSFRTKIEKEEDKKRGLESTRSLSYKQKLRIILPGKGIFSSEIVNNARELVIRMPTQKEQITVESQDWINKSINVYLWRTGDARYVFDTKVNSAGVYMGRACLFLQHTDNLTRTNKRNAVRAKCHLQASLYILREKVIDYSTIETKPGYRCLLEDISEKGALIRIGGKGVPNIQIRLQYQLEGHLIVMFGVVRTVEYNEEHNQSRLHFECLHIDETMKNQVLSYVYNILPENEKEIFDALSLTDKDEQEVENSSEQKENNSAEAEEQKTKQVLQDLPETDDVLKNIPNEENLSSTSNEANNDNDDLPIIE